MLKRDKQLSAEDKPTIITAGEEGRKESQRLKKKSQKPKKEALFVRVLNRLLKLDCLKLLELSIGFVKGFAVKIEFFEDKTQEKEKIK